MANNAYKRKDSQASWYPDTSCSPSTTLRNGGHLLVTVSQRGTVPCWYLELEPLSPQQALKTMTRMTGLKRLKSGLWGCRRFGGRHRVVTRVPGYQVSGYHNDHWQAGTLLRRDPYPKYFLWCAAAIGDDGSEETGLEFEFQSTNAVSGDFQSTTRSGSHWQAAGGPGLRAPRNRATRPRP